MQNQSERFNDTERRKERERKREREREGERERDIYIVSSDTKKIYYYYWLLSSQLVLFVVEKNFIKPDLLLNLSYSWNLRFTSFILLTTFFPFSTMSTALVVDGCYLPHTRQGNCYSFFTSGSVIFE